MNYKTPALLSPPHINVGRKRCFKSCGANCDCLPVKWCNCEYCSAERLRVDEVLAKRRGRRLA